MKEELSSCWVSKELEPFAVSLLAQENPLLSCINKEVPRFKVLEEARLSFHAAVCLSIFERQLNLAPYVIPLG